MMSMPHGRTGARGACGSAMAVSLPESSILTFRFKKCVDFVWEKQYASHLKFVVDEIREFAS